MQTPKSRNSSSVSTAPKNSPRSNSSESSRKNSPAQPASSSSEATKKVSPRVVRQLKTGPRYSDHATSSVKLVTKIPKEGSPKVSDHRSPKSLVSETKRPSRVSELESQVSQLENDLKTVRAQLSDTEASKKRAEKDAEDANQQILDLSLKLEESQKKHSASKESFSYTSQEQEPHDETALASALEEIKRLKIQLEMVAESEATRYTYSEETEQVELSQLRQNLSETLLLVEDMRKQLKDSKESEAQAHAMVEDTLIQLENAKKTVEMLRSEGLKDTRDYDAMASELEKSRARVIYLEELVNKLKGEISSGIDGKTEMETTTVSTEAEICSTKLEVQHLRSALEAAELRYNEEQARSTESIRNALEIVEKIKSEAGQRESELEAELQQSKYQVEELKANLMDKETELQGICEENEGLTTKLEKALSGQREVELENELDKSKTDIKNLKALLMDKEKELQNIVEEHKKLKSQIKEATINKENDEPISDVDSFKVSEKDDLMKVSYLTEEIDKSNRNVTRITKQLEAAQAANADMEAELRRLKVQSDQWRKASEAAAAMISGGNNNNNNNNNWQITERTGSMDSRYSPKISSPYSDDLDDDDLLKKKNANVLRRFWKKPQK